MAQTFGPCGQIIVEGGAGAPPASLTANFGASGGSQSAFTELLKFGCSQSAPIQSATLTEVVNITGSGVFSFAALHSANATTFTNGKFRIVIDGVTVLNESTINVSVQTGAACAVGLYASSGTSSSGISQGRIMFNTSIVISIASDGVGFALLSYKRYLTS